MQRSGRNSSYHLLTSCVNLFMLSFHATILGLLCRRPLSPWNNQSNLSSHNITPPTQERISPVLTTGGTYQPIPVFQTKHVDAPLQKRTQSPTLPAATGFPPENARLDGHNRLAGKFSFTSTANMESCLLTVICLIKHNQLSFV